MQKILKKTIPIAIIFLLFITGTVFINTENIYAKQVDTPVYLNLPASSQMIDRLEPENPVKTEDNDLVLGYIISMILSGVSSFVIIKKKGEKGYGK